MYTVVSASSMFQRIEKRLRDRHEEMKTMRKMRLSTIRHDIDRVVREEAAFTRKLVKDLIPLEVNVKEGFLDNMPIRIKPKDGFVDMFKDDKVPHDKKDGETDLAPTLD